MRRLLLVLLVLSLGCINENAAPARDYGVIIKAFETDMSEIKTGNQLSVRLQVENAGDFDADNVKAWIFNCGDFTNCGSTADFHTLSKADLKASLAGESKDTVWKISSDKLMSENERLVQDIGVKVAYDYSSNAVAEIPVVSEDRYRELERLGKLSSSRVESSLSPVSLKITAPGIVVGSEQFAVKIDLEKTSDGFVQGCGGTTGCIDSVTITPSAGVSKVSGGCEDSTNFNLWRSGSASMTCILKADASCGSECNPTVKVTAKYRFVVEKSTSVTIIGTGVAVPSGGGPAPTPTPTPTPVVTPLVCPTDGKGKALIYSLEPDTGKAGDTIVILGSNYMANEKNIKVIFEKAGGGFFKELDATPVTGSPGSKGSLEADANGCFKVTAPIPSDAPQGEFLVYALGEKATTGYTSDDYIKGGKKFTIGAATGSGFSLSPSKAKVGEAITVSGGGYVPGSDVSIYLEGAMLYDNEYWIKKSDVVRKLDATPLTGFLPGTLAGSLKADSTGSIKATVKLPFESVPGSLYIYPIAEGTCPTTEGINGIKKPVELQKVAYIESISKASMKIGDTATVKGMGFAANEDNIKIYLAAPGAIKKPASTHTLLQMAPTSGNLAGTDAGSLKANANGEIEGTFTLQAGPASRDYSVYALGAQAGTTYTIEQALNGRKIVFVEFGAVPSDNDKDGIEDLLDECQKTPIGIPVDGKGCPLIFISMLGSGTCDYKANGQADIVARIKNAATSRVYGVSGLVKDSTASASSYPSTCISRTFEAGETFDAKASITSLATGKHKITAIIYSGSSSSNEIDRTEGLEFDVPANSCPIVKVLSTTPDKAEYTLLDPVKIDIVVENQGTIDIAKLNVSVTWLGLPESRVFERDECITPLAKNAKYTCSVTGTDLSRVGDYKAVVNVKEIREPAELPLLTAEEYVLLRKKA